MIEIFNLIVCFLSTHTSEIFSALITLVSAFGGAWFAFKIQNIHERKVMDDKNRTSINIAQISLMQKYNHLLVIKKNFISPFPNDPLDWINIPALSPREKAAEIDFSSLSILIDSNNASVISEVLLSNEYYNEIIKSINIRSNIHIEELQPKYGEIRKKYNDQLSEKILLYELGEKTVGALMNATREILKIIPEAIQQIEKTIDLVYKTGKELYPKGKILYVKSQENTLEEQSA